MKDQLMIEVLKNNKTGYFIINIQYPNGRILYSETVAPHDYRLKVAILEQKWGIS